MDAHCHLEVLPEAALERARKAGVEAAVGAGYGPERWPAQARLAGGNLAMAYGVHPWRLAEGGDVDELVTRLRDWLAGHPADGVGEMGLDRLRGEAEPQERLFVAQLALARELDLPVVLHVVRRHGRALEILRREGLPAAGGMVHGFRGSAEVARDYVRLGLHVSFGADARAADAVPLDRLLLETDAPDGEPDPAGLVRVLEAVAARRDEPPSEVARATAANARQLFWRDHGHR